jgi:uncharacterized protein YjiS (DUF1127 family)
MLTITPTRRSLLRSNLTAAAVDTLRDCRRAVASLAARWRREREARSAERALRQLGPYLLRDLGLHSSEIASIVHAAGAGDDSRLRLTRSAYQDLARLY